MSLQLHFRAGKETPRVQQGEPPAPPRLCATLPHPLPPLGAGSAGWARELTRSPSQGARPPPIPDSVTRLWASSSGDSTVTGARRGSGTPRVAVSPSGDPCRTAEPTEPAALRGEASLPPAPQRAHLIAANKPRGFLCPQPPPCVSGTLSHGAACSEGCCVHRVCPGCPSVPPRVTGHGLIELASGLSVTSLDVSLVTTLITESILSGWTVPAASHTQCPLWASPVRIRWGAVRPGQEEGCGHCKGCPVPKPFEVSGWGAGELAASKASFMELEVPTTLKCHDTVAEATGREGGPWGRRAAGAVLGTLSSLGAPHREDSGKGHACFLGGLGVGGCARPETGFGRIYES